MEETIVSTEVKKDTEIAEVKSSESGQAEKTEEVKEAKKAKKIKKAKDADKDTKEKKEKKAGKFFSAFKGFVKKHKKLTVFLCIILVLLVAFIIFKLKNKNQDQFTVMTATGMVEIQDLTTTVSASGKLLAKESKDIAATELTSAGAKFTEINVKLGDVVSEGDIICTLDTELLNEELTVLENQLKARKIKNQNSKESTERSVESTKISGVTRTYRNIEAVDDAQKVLDTKIGELSEAQRIYDKEYEIYHNLYSEDKYYSLKEKDANGTISASERTELSQQENAKSNLASIKSQVDSAQAAVESAKDTLKRAQENYTDTIRQDINSIKDADDSLENIRADELTADVDLEKSIREKKEQIAAATVVAPFSGTVTLINYSVGDSYKGDTIIKLEDASSFIIETSVDEYDISRMEVGQRVIFKTNATGTEELSGVVSQVAPRATAAASTGQGSSGSSQSSSYKIVIDVTSTDEKLRMDMTAKINIVVEEALGVFAVPTDAIYMDEMGRNYIRVEDNSLPAGAADVLDGDAGNILPTLQIENQEEVAEKIIYVETGMESNYYTEVKSSELKEGMIVIISNDESAATIDDLMIQIGPMGGM